MFRSNFPAGIGIGAALVISPAWIPGQSHAGEPAPVAQTTPTTGFDEIVVTAQRREESVQDTPLAIDVVTADALIREGIRDIQDITKSSTVLETNTRNGGRT